MAPSPLWYFLSLVLVGLDGTFASVCVKETGLAGTYPCKDVDVEAVIQFSELTALGGRVPPGPGFTTYAQSDGSPAQMCQLCETDMPTPPPDCLAAGIAFYFEPTACSSTDVFNPATDLDCMNPFGSPGYRADCTTMQRFCASCSPVANCIIDNGGNAAPCAHLVPGRCEDDYTQVCNSGDRGSDVWGFSEKGRDFALVCLAQSTAFVEVTVPSEPVILGYLPSPDGVNPSNWCDIKVVYESGVPTMYKVTEAVNHGIQKFVLSPALSSVVAGDPQKFAATDRIGIDSFHNLVVNTESSMLYAVGGQACHGMHALNLKQGGETCLTIGYVHDADCVTYNGPDKTYVGKEICVTFMPNNDGVVIWQIAIESPMSATEISRFTYSNSAYPHQGSLSPDHRYLLFGDEGDELQFGINATTYMYDLNSLSSPAPMKPYTEGFANTDHNLYFFGGEHVYQSDNLRGLRVFNFTPNAGTKLSEVAYLEMAEVPSNPRATGGGWSNFQFASDDGVAKVVMNTKTEGLFVLTVMRRKKSVANGANRLCFAGSIIMLLMTM